MHRSVPPTFGDGTFFIPQYPPKTEGDCYPQVPSQPPSCWDVPSKTSPGNPRSCLPSNRSVGDPAEGSLPSEGAPAPADLTIHCHRNMYERARDGREA